MYSREALPSRMLILDQIMDALKDPNLNAIGVYGMGGVGKTTLAKEVLGQTAVQMLFETVALVAVSQTPDLRRIQVEIADALGLQFKAEEVPGRASELHQRLKKAKVLIILDDVWQKLDLNAIGIPSADASQGCKIFLTSRKKDVLRSEMGTQKEFPLDVLEEEETLRLFEKSVSMGNDPELHALANEVANKCAGLPLLILKVATDLRNKDSYAWKYMIAQLSSSENTEIYEKVHKVIESSYEKLIDQEAKSHYLQHAFIGKGHIRSTDMESKDCRRISLPYCDIPQLPEVLQCPEAEVFSMFAEDLSLDMPASFFEGVKKLKVLHFSGVSFVSGLPSSPDSRDSGLVDLFSGLTSSLGFLTSLKTLSLQGCRLNNVAIVAQLEFLTFADSNVEELPKEIEALTRLKLLHLTGCDHLQVIPSNVLSNLRLLEELYVHNRYHGWDTEGNASLVELKNLSRLTTLNLWFLPNLRGICRISRGTVSFPNLTSLEFYECNSLKYVFTTSMASSLPQLKKLEISLCESMEEIILVSKFEEVAEDSINMIVFLRLFNLSNLKRFSSGYRIEFPKLRELNIESCPELDFNCVCYHVPYTCCV